jgi:hypothetical protein
VPALAIALLVVLLVPATADATRSWLPPVDGTVLRAFVLGADPYARGAHRGADLAAREGAPVRSACSGRVTFAGRVPRGGQTVSVRCGELVATYQQLGAIAVSRGSRVGAGAALGSVGPSSDPRTRAPHVHLGAREAATGRYVDPLSLLRGVPPAAPLLPGRAPRRTPPGPAPLPAPPRAAPRLAPPVAPRVAPRRAPLVAPRAAPFAPRAAPDGGVTAPAPGVPWPVWAGLASIALALPLGGRFTMRRRGGRSKATAHAAVAPR